MGVKVNVTAVMDYWQIENVMRDLSSYTPSIVSVFAGRIADTGRDPVGMVNYAMENVSADSIKILWASPRQVADVWEAERIGCDIITISKDILAKMELRHKDLSAFSLETVKMFRSDALAAGYTL
jgi:transaldolase